MSDEPQVPDYGPFIMATHVLLIGLIGKMKAKGLVTGDDLDDVMDLAMLGLEEMGLHNRNAQAVHAILEQDRSILRGQLPPAPKNSGR
jgi:hypothetical protein